MKRNTIGIEDAVLLDNKLWFILSDYKCLGSMDIKTKEMKSYTIPSGGSYTRNRSYASMALVGRKIYLIPFYDRVLFQFDVDSEKFTEVNLLSRVIENKVPLFMGVGVCGDYLFVMGVNSPAILRIDTVNNHVDYITGWQKDVEKLIFDPADAYFRRQSVVIDDKLYVPFCNANAVLEIDCNSMATTIHSMGDEKQGYSGICYDGESLWLSPRKNGSMLKWNPATGHIDVIQISELKELGNTLTYAGVIAQGNKVLLLPTAKRKSLSVKAENVAEADGTYSVVQEGENNIILYDRNSGIFNLIDKGSLIQTDIEMGIVSIDVERVMHENGNVASENAMLSVNDFIQYIQEKK